MFRYWRLNLLFLIFILIGAALISRLFFLQVKNHGFYAAMAHGQHQSYEDLNPERGRIFVKDKFGIIHPLALNKEFKTIYASPKEIEDKGIVVERLSSVLKIGKEFLIEKLNKNSSYEIIASKVDKDAAREVFQLDIRGIYQSGEKFRHYPQGEFASHVTGFFGYEGDIKLGRYGLEEYYNDLLSGKVGLLKGEKDVFGDWIAVAEKRLIPAKDGADLFLTIDLNIQHKTEKILKEYLEKWDADGGTIIVSDPITGAVMSMANLPSFNPNQYSDVKDISNFMNSATQKIFEPGSILKPITMTAGLDKDVITPDTKYIDEGELKIGGYTIQNSDLKKHDEQTMIQVLEKSLNTGAVFVAQRLGLENFRDYMRNFGFDKKTGVDLEGEIAGDIKNLYSGREINLATASFGQGIAVTPIELVVAFSAIANQGKIMKPYLVEKFKQDNGEEKITEPEILKEVISPKTASQLTAMMVSVIDNGFGKKAGVKGYFVAGKTGTAQVPAEDKRGYSDKTTHSFIGFAPAYNPKFLIFIKLDNPKGIRFSSDSITPAFSKLAKYILDYYEIPPER